MGNTEVCPIAVNPTERGICTILTTKWVQSANSYDKMGAESGRSFREILLTPLSLIRTILFRVYGVDGRPEH